MASKRDPQFPDITDISPLQYYHLLEQGRRPTRSQFAKLRSDNPAPEKPAQLEVPAKRKASASQAEPKKKPKREDTPLPLSPSKKEEELNYLAAVVWGPALVGRKVVVKQGEERVVRRVVAVVESPHVEYMPAQYQLEGGEVADLRSSEVLVCGQVAYAKDCELQVVARPGGPLSPDSITLRNLSPHNSAILTLPSSALRVLASSDCPHAAQEIADYKEWDSHAEKVAVTIENVQVFVLRFVCIKTRKETKNGLLLRHNEQTGKVLLYVGTKLKWERFENCEITGNLSTPPVPIKLLSSFQYESDLQRLYHSFYTKDSPDLEPARRSEAALRKEVRCAVCKYILDELEFRECGKCRECTHVQCLEDSLSAIPLRGTWRCGNCPRCENCFSDIGKFFRCKACNSCFHEKCVDLLLAPTPGKNWKCENCAVCQFCGVRAAQHSVKWNDAITMCHTCDTKWKKREYCPICNRFWYFEGDRLSEHVDPLILLESQNMIQCDKCQMWIHMKCDRNVSLEELAQYAIAGNSKKYFCPVCTIDKKNDDMIKIVKELTALDSNDFFRHYVDDYHYNKVIKQQMCFDQMMDFARTGAYTQNPMLLKNHFKLICDNAMCFYKTNASGYVTAQQLLKDGMEVLQKRLSLPCAKKKPAEPRPPKPKRAKTYLEKHLPAFNLPLPTSITKPETYDFDTDRSLSLASISFQPPNDFFKIVIMKKDIQPYRKARDKPTIYVMGAAVSYVDQRLNYVEMCYLCSSFAREEQAWVCTVCGRAFHEFCLEVEKGQNKENWRCRECRVCELCQRTGDFSTLLYCSDCGKAFDTTCLWPHLSAIPAITEWKCEDCFVCSRCGTRSFRNGRAPEELREIYKDQDFTKCYQCFWVLRNKLYCPVCQGDWASPYTESETYQEKLLCKHCGFAFHRTCIDGPWRGGCSTCLSKHMDFAEAEQTTIQQVQTLMELVSQINFYKSLCKDEVERHYHLSPDLAKLLSNFFLVENADFMSSQQDIKRLFRYRGVDIVKKRSSKEANYRTTSLPMFHGLRRSDVPLATVPEIRVHAPGELLPIYSVSWDTSAVADALLQFYSPLDSFSVVKETDTVFPSDPGIYREVRSVVWEFGQFLPVEPIVNFDQVLHGTCYWFALETETRPPPSKDSKPHDEELALPPSKSSELDVLTNEIDPLSLATQLVNHEVPTALAFSERFEKWLRSSLVKLTLHILNRNKQSKAGSVQVYSPAVPEYSQLEMGNNLLIERKRTGFRKLENDPVQHDGTTFLTCIFCKEPGERQLSGRLLPTEDNLWAHVSCGYWSTDIECMQDCGGLMNCSQAVTRGRKSKCSGCGSLGATLMCSSKKCHNHYHFPCALLAAVRFFEPKIILCKDCALTKDLAAKTQLDTEELRRLTQRKWVFTTGKRYARKPPFVHNAFNRTGSLILCEIPERGVHELFESYRLSWLDGKRTLIGCVKRDQYFRVVDISSNREIARAEEIDGLWPVLKAGESFYIQSAADFFGYSSISVYLPPCPETTSYFRSLKEKKPKSLQEILSTVHSPHPGASIFLPYDKHRFCTQERVKTSNTKSTHFEDTEVGHRKDDLTLASDYRKYKKAGKRDEHLEVLGSTIHGLGLFTKVE